MKRIQFSTALILSSIMSMSVSFADSDRPLFSVSVSESGVPQSNSEGGITRSSTTESRVLPIWGDEARARGYDLPEPFGVSYGYMNLRQDIIVDKIGFNSDTRLGQGLLSNILVETGHTREKNESHMLKLDAWVLPFMNIYGVYGKTKGSSKTNITGIYMKGQPGPMWENLPFSLDFKGKTYGGGVTFAGGYNQFFGTLDLNYTKTNLDILDGDITAFVMTPRIGYEFVFEPLISGQGNTKVQIWTGAMYQDITQRFKGDVSKLNLPEELDFFMNNPAMKPIIGNVKFDVKQHLAHKWNNTVGARVELTRNFNVLTEIGFNNRNSFFISGEFRF
ncbi:hypothetical protein AB6F64_02190 [Providencia hangzhouensis]|uniref:Lipoprotein n=1 Tax=Providencia rettgeri TaxID=587 RepID=A0AAJ4NIN3_PRORE|nr:MULTISPECIES: hypothetical protein [Providencia]MBJ9973490.1 hypothetical protein [Providencia rettgeri]MCF8965158.1 hypothetical protein [Providencia rettgeri]QWQ17363.1 hypothetical protein KOL65_02225 [Providencia rettgeri]QWQ21198.1 hypothetical protein KOF27_02225 [Providencia rettgeri]QWQ25034.1 hypothetical protein KOL64_02225 [Providencia rettgeri]